MPRRRSLACTDSSHSKCRAVLGKATEGGRAGGQAGGQAVGRAGGQTKAGQGQGRAIWSLSAGRFDAWKVYQATYTYYVRRVKVLEHI